MLSTGGSEDNPDRGQIPGKSTKPKPVATGLTPKVKAEQLQEGIMDKVTICPYDSNIHPMKIRVPTDFGKQKGVNIHLSPEAKSNVLYLALFNDGNSVRMHNGMKGGILKPGDMATFWFTNYTKEPVKNQQIGIRVMKTDKSDVTQEEVHKAFYEDISADVLRNLISINMDIVYIPDTTS